MERLTNKNCYSEMAHKVSPAEPDYPSVWIRLCEIENILGDNYDLEKLKSLILSEVRKKTVYAP